MNLISRAFSIGLTITTFGCSSAITVKYRIESDPEGVQVDLNGQNMGATPLELSLSCQRKWVGVANSTDGYEYLPSPFTITAYPSMKNPGFSQSKTINACQARDTVGSVKFDLSLIPIR